MDGYPEVYLDHFQYPRWVGQVENTTHHSVNHVLPGTGCFDQLEITLCVHDDIVEEARFRGRLCSGSVAAASLLMTMIQNKSISEIMKINKADLANIWSFIPTGKDHSIELAISTLHSALSPTGN